MKILLIQPSQDRGLGFRSLAVVEPLGLETIAGSLPEHQVRILDLRLENHLPKILQDFEPDFCGINCSFTIDVYQTQEIAAVIKGWNSRVPVFIGGHHASLSPEDFCTPHIDGVVIGEGERAIRELAEVLQSGGDLKSISGMLLNEPSGPHFTVKRPMIANLDELPMPARVWTITSWPASMSSLAALGTRPTRVSWSSSTKTTSGTDEHAAATRRTNARQFSPGT